MPKNNQSSSSLHQQRYQNRLILRQKKRLKQPLKRKMLRLQNQRKKKK
jgi:hypothetical protein